MESNSLAQFNLSKAGCDGKLLVGSTGLDMLCLCVCVLMWSDDDNKLRRDLFLNKISYVSRCNLCTNTPITTWLHVVSVAGTSNCLRLTSNPKLFTCNANSGQSESGIYGILTWDHCLLACTSPQSPPSAAWSHLNGLSVCVTLTAGYSPWDS